MQGTDSRGQNKSLKSNTTNKFDTKQEIHCTRTETPMRTSTSDSEQLTSQ